MNSGAEFGYFRKASAENSGRAQRLSQGALKTLAGTTKNKNKNNDLQEIGHAPHQHLPETSCFWNLCALPVHAKVPVRIFVHCQCFLASYPKRGKRVFPRSHVVLCPASVFRVRICVPCQSCQQLKTARFKGHAIKNEDFCDAERCDNTGLPDQSQTCERNNNCRPHYDLRPAIHMAVASRCFHWLLPVVGSLLLVSKGFHVYLFIHDTRIFKNQNHNNGLKQSMFQNMH